MVILVGGPGDGEVFHDSSICGEEIRYPIRMENESMFSIIPRNNLITHTVAVYRYRRYIDENKRVCTPYRFFFSHYEG
jgi:hypothetical protein